MNRFRIQSLLVSISLAAVGFSIALATSTPGGAFGSPAEKSARLTGALQFSNPRSPFVVGTNPTLQGFYDLGDAAFGSQVVRYMSAFGGTRPYQFTSSTIGTSGLNTGTNGYISGLLTAGTPSPFYFNATVTDAEGKAQNGGFRLGTTKTATEFRFAQDQLPSALLGEDYITNVELIGASLSDAGNSAVDGTPVAAGSASLSIVSGSLMYNGIPLSTLESIGLSLFPDGALAGRPLKAGKIAFTLRAQKSGSSVLAHNRANNANDQPLSINVLAQNAVAGGAVQTVFAASATNLRANRVPGKDILGLNAFYDPDGMQGSDFAGKLFTLRFAGRTYTTTLDAFGQSRSSVVQVQNSAPTGLLKIKVRAQDFSNLFLPAAIPDKSLIVLPVEMQIGDKYLGTEPVEYFVSNRHGNLSMKYVIGRQRQPGGLFQILSVKAIDTSVGTAFSVKFLINEMPDSSSETFGNAQDITIGIGPKFSETLQLFHNRGRFQSPGIQSVNINARSKVGQIVTYPLSSDMTGIASSVAGKMQTFALSVLIHTDTQTFSGKASRRIFPFNGR